MGLRSIIEQHKGERDVFGTHGTATRYHLRQRLLTVGGAFWVQDDGGSRVFRIDSAAIEDAHGTTLCRIVTEGLVLQDSMHIEDADGESVAVVHRSFVSPVHEQWHVSLADLTQWAIDGAVARHEYEIRTAGHTVAHVSKRGHRAKGTYAVEIAPGENTALVLAIAVVADAIQHSEG